MADMVEAAREAREADEISDNAKNENEAFQERDEQNTHGPGSTRVSLVTEKEAAPSLLPPLENRTEFPAQEGQAADEEYDDEETEDDDEETEDDENFLNVNNHSDDSSQGPPPDIRPVNLPPTSEAPTSTSAYNILLGNARRETPLKANIFAPGMRILGVHKTGFLESARVDKVLVTTNELLITWLSGCDTQLSIVLPMSRIRFYAGHLVGTEEKSEFDFASEEEIRRQNQLRSKRDPESMQVPDSNTKRRLVPLMMQMLDTFPLADDDFNLLPERTVECSKAELRPYSRKKVRVVPREQSERAHSTPVTHAVIQKVSHCTHTQYVNRDDDDMSSCSSGMFVGFHPDEARASDAQMTVDQPVVKAAIVRVFKSLIGKDDHSFLQ